MPYTSAEAVSRVLDRGLVAILRAPSGELLSDVVEALATGGIDVAEITFTVPRALEVLQKVADQCGDRVLLGAGTVLDSETARAALLAGAQYLVTPTLNLDVIRLCRRYGKAVFPGALTPTEILTAWEAGADLVKIFPSEITGPAYLAALAGPLPHVRLMPTGGVNLETGPVYLRAGAAALGVGGALVSADALARRDLAGIEAQARRFVEMVAQARRELASR